MIKLQVIGHLGKDATVNTVNGKNVINFSVAHTEKYKDSQGNVNEKTTWVDCAKWGDNTAVAQYLTKGKQVYVEGNPELRTYQKQDGSFGASMSCRVGLVQLLGGNSGGGQQQQQAAGQAPAAAAGQTQGAAVEQIDDLPF